MEHRVVITGLGVAAPNGVGIAVFREAIRNGICGIRREPALEALQFACQIAGTPQVPESLQQQYLEPLELRNFNSNGILYGIIAGVDAWKDAGLPVAHDAAPDWDSGTIFGAGSAGVDKLREAIYKVDDMQVRRLGSTVVPQVMASGISAWLGGKLGLGNQVTTNSSACATGVESVLMAFERIRNGSAKRMLAGSTSDAGPYIWGGFDALKICNYRSNEAPEKGSRPMSASAGGIVPGAGAGALVLESLGSALERGAHIYGEVLGGHVNSGGQRGDGTMTAPNSQAVQQCIIRALQQANVAAHEIDAINAHLTATGKDALEIENWCKALNRQGTDFPYINALKSMIGHCMSGAGSIELVASALQLHEGFIFPNINCEDLHPEIAALVDPEKIPTRLIEKELNLIAKASFGFGDVNACIILQKYK